MDYQDVTLAQLTNLDNIRMLAEHGYALYGLKVGDPGTQIWARPRPVAAVASPAPMPDETDAPPPASAPAPDVVDAPAAGEAITAETARKGRR